MLFRLFLLASLFFSCSVRGNANQSFLNDDSSKNGVLDLIETDILQNLSSSVSIFEDKNSTFTLTEIQKKVFTSNKKNNLYFPFSASTFWVKIDLRNKNVHQKEWILEWDNALAENVDFYIPDSTGAYKIKKMGAFNARQFRVLEYNPHISLLLNYLQEKIIYIKLKSNRGHNTELLIQSPKIYDDNYFKSTVSSGFLSGLVFLRLFYVLLIAIFAVKELAFRQYSVLLVMRSIAFWGIGSTLGGIFTNNPIDAAHINFLSYHILPIGQVLVVMAILPINKFHPFVKYILFSIVVLTLILSILIMLNYQWIWLLASTYLVIFTQLFIIGLYIYSFFRKYSFNIYYSIPFLLGIGSYVFWQMRLVGWVDFVWIVPFATLCFVSEIFVFGIFLGRIIINYERNRAVSEKQLLFNQTQTLRLQELDALKTNFFTNISHEFRTPLTLILSPLENLKTQFPEKDIFQIMYRNAKRLLDLINQLLDLSKLEAKQMIPIIEKVELVYFFRTLTSSFSSQAVNQKIVFSIEQNQDFFWGYVDKDKLEKILTNLLSNAFKFTGEGKNVSVKIDYQIDNQFVIIEVSDEGIGISKEKLSKIFQRFYQINDSRNKVYEGTGIGLALVKELVDVLKGTLKVESEQNIGTSFFVKLPISENSWQGYIIENDVNHENEKVESDEFKTDYLSFDSEEMIPAKFENVILIVDDNADMRTYINSIFADSYQVIEAIDGADGLEKATLQVPDLIISDLMMPKLDGFEFCKQIKTNEKTSHIPIIMLTAKATVESRIEGFELGADDYLTKPFNVNEMLARVKNLITVRENLKKRYGKELVDLKPSEVKVDSIDEQFLKKAKAVIEENIGNPRFDVEQFADNMNLSNVQLRRKIRALTNFTVIEFIRYYRLQKATNLLSQNAGTISEIAYQVGFDSLTYFGRVFQEVYKMSPTEYRNQF